MEQDILSHFLQQSDSKSFSRKHRQTIQFNIGRYAEKVAQGKQQFADLEAARRAAKNIKWQAIENLPTLLLEFERNFTARGGQVLWAEDAAQARILIKNILEEEKADLVVKSKSMMTEEIELNAFLEEQQIEVLETDLGEYIVQLRHESPYHIITPAMHLSKGDVAELFHQKFALAENSSPEQIMAFVREQMRAKFASAKVGITGANFIIADTGSILITENEGNARLTTSLPPVHIALVGIEKMIPSAADLDIMLPLLATYGTGQQLTVYNTLLSAPRQSKEKDGPQKMYVILIDNGRSKILADPYLRESLQCIRCGSCLNNCPVYKNIGGHSYDSAYPGPIGAVLMPHLEGFEQKAHLSNASSLCGACTESCPVKINLHGLILYNRKIETDRALKPENEAKMWRMWAWLSKKRWLMNSPRFAKRWFARRYLVPLWGQRRVFPNFEGKTFNQLWKQGLV